MQQHDSTVAQTEMREGIAKIISLAGVREAMATKAGQGGGIEVVSIGDKNKNGQMGGIPTGRFCLTFPERETGVEPATSTLARRCEPDSPSEK